MKRSGLRCGGRRLTKMVTMALSLTLLIGTMGCNGSTDQIRQETLADVEFALAAALEISQNADTDEIARDKLLKVLPDLESAAGLLADCTSRGDDCLAQSLPHLLDADRALVAMAELDLEDTSDDIRSLMVPVRSAATRLYDHFYATGSSSQGDKWRGKPTPRPPGVCPGG